MAEGILAGAIFGFVDSLLLCGTGTAVPITYRVLVFPLTLLMSAIASCGLAFIGTLLGWGGFGQGRECWTRVIPFVVLAGPLVLLAFRSQPPVSMLPVPALAALRWAVPAVLLVALAVVHRRSSSHGTRGGVSLACFLKLALLTQALGILATAVRRCNPFALVDLWGHHKTQLVVLLLALVAYSAALIALTRLGSVFGNGRPGRAVAAGVLLSLVSTLGAARWSLPQSIEAPLPHFAATRSPSGPTTLLITLDTVRRDHLSCYGYALPTTPHLDAFAANATIFVDAIASSPYTLSSHASLFTGRLPSDHGAHRVPYDDVRLARLVRDFALPDREETLAQVLLHRGYHTGAIVANSGYLAEWTGLQHGFEYYRVSPNWSMRYWPLSLGALVQFFPSVAPTVFAKQSMLSASDVTGAALEWFRRLDGQPSFLFLNYMEAHAPYRPPAPYDRRFLPGDVKSPLWPMPYRPPDLKALPDAEEMRLRIALYDGAIAFQDAEIGRLLDGLKAAGLLDQMLVVITSDHGESFGEHGLIEHTWELYEDVLRIPLIIRLPGQTEGMRVASRISLQDVRGLIERVVDGAHSPSALFGGLRETGPRVVAQQWISARAHELYPQRFGSPYLQAIYDGRWKLIQRVRGPSELYDLQTDAAEARDLFRINPSAAATQEARLTADLPRPLKLLSSRGEVRGQSPQDLDGLRALGYVH
jgi:arylsulfatase A-like enzyme